MSTYIEEPDIPVKKQYHPAFCNAMELELYEDRNLLEFQEGVELNTLPREIDFIVIRKEVQRWEDFLKRLWIR